MLMKPIKKKTRAPKLPSGRIFDEISRLLPQQGISGADHANGAKSACSPFSRRSAPPFLAFRCDLGVCIHPSGGGPRVRIHLPPAESQSLGRIRVRGSRTPAFRAGVGGWLGDAVGRDAQGFPIRANLRQYLCRAIFQYRSAADVVGEDPTPIPTKSGIPRFNVRQIFEFGLGSSKAEHGALIVPSERQT